MPTPEIRIASGEEGREDYLDECLRDDLRDECTTLDGLLADAVAPAAKPADPYSGLRPSRLHVSGTEVSGNIVELISMGRRSDKWIVRNGSKMRTLQGTWVRYQTHPTERLKKDIAHSLDAAIAAVK